MDAYGKAWENGDTDAIGKMFVENARYYETPFDEPMTGLDEIERYWREGAKLAQANVKFRYEIVCVNGAAGWSRWQASFVRVPSGTKVALDGVIQAEFAEDHRCKLFREWWHRQETDE